jgi:chromosome segregation ATPase
MNQPLEERFTKLEGRIENIEQTFKEVIKNEEQLIRLSQRHRHNTEHLKVIIDGIVLDMGDTRERFDNIERTLAQHGEMLKSHIGDTRERLDGIERTQTEHSQSLKHQGEVLESHGDLLRQILSRLESR